MQFTLEKDVFLKALAKVQSVVEKRHTIPILSNVLIEANDEGIRLTATDLEVGIRTQYPARVGRKGTITVSAKKLFEIIKELPDADISFQAKENCWIEIRCGKSLFNVVGLSAEEFPPFPEMDQGSQLTIEASVLRDMVEKTAFSMSTDDTKYNLNGIFFRGVQEGETATLNLVATDGHRLALTRRTLALPSLPLLERGLILPRKGITELRKITDEGEGPIALFFTDNNAMVARDQTLVVMRLVDGDFPDYSRVIPKQKDQIVQLPRDLFLHALRRASVLSNEKSRGVKLHFEPNRLQLSSSQSEVGEAHEELDVTYNGPTIDIGFNARYLIDILQALDCDMVELALKDSVSPGMIQIDGDDSFLAVVMPMRL